MVTLIFHNLIMLEMQEKGVRGLPLFPVILLFRVLPVNEIRTIRVMFKYGWRRASLMLQFIYFPTS